jgi:excisionase family DNA binding protein
MRDNAPASVVEVSTKAAASDRAERRHPRTLPPDVQTLSWAADQLGISKPTAYRLALAGQIPGQFKIGRQYRVSVPRFLREVHGCDRTSDDAEAE